MLGSTCSYYVFKSQLIVPQDPYCPLSKSHISKMTLCKPCLIIPGWLIKLPMDWAGRKRSRCSEGLWACVITEGPWGGEREEKERSKWPWGNQETWPMAACTED